MVTAPAMTASDLSKMRKSVHDDVVAVAYKRSYDDGGVEIFVSHKRVNLEDEARGGLVGCG